LSEKKNCSLKKYFFIGGVDSVEVAFLEAMGNADIYFGSKNLGFLNLWKLKHDSLCTGHDIPFFHWQ